MSDEVRKRDVHNKLVEWKNSVRMSPYKDEGWMENIPLYAVATELDRRINS